MTTTSADAQGARESVQARGPNKQPFSWLAVIAPGLSPHLSLHLQRMGWKVSCKGEGTNCTASTLKIQKVLIQEVEVHSKFLLNVLQ